MIQADEHDARPNESAACRELEIERQAATARRDSRRECVCVCVFADRSSGATVARRAAPLVLRVRLSIITAACSSVALLY
eukprot:8165841-Pyramimonas_sp.AAC.2